MKIEFEEYRIIIDNKTIYLTNTQKAILELLYNNKNKLITYEMIAKTIFQLECEELLKSLIRQHISLLRKKIDQYIKIHTIRGVGYIIEEEWK